MSYSITTTGRFEKEIKKLIKKFPSLKNEYATLISILRENPYCGIPIGNKCYKIRVAIASEGAGKSGGARVITHVHVSDNKIYLLSIYDKSEQSSIANSEIISILNTIQ